ncbi:SIMPL domain-containing protein [bacterium]|nr:SIMPL domain-containing protein [bacterium]
MKKYFVIFGIATLSFFWFVTGSVAQDVKSEPDLLVSAEGLVETEADICEMKLGVYFLEKDLMVAKRSADRVVRKVLTLFKGFGIAEEDIQTSEIYVKPMNRKEWKGHEVTRSVKVTLRNIKLMNNLLNKCIALGVNRITYFRLKSSKQGELEGVALDKAIAQAKRKAEEQAAWLGLKLGKLHRIKEGRTYVSTVSAPLFTQGVFLPGIIRIESSIKVGYELTE